MSVSTASLFAAKEDESEGLENAPRWLRKQIAFGEPFDRGGFGLVYRIKDRDAFDRPAVCKVLKPIHIKNIEVCRRFQQECKIMTLLEPASVPPVYRSGKLPSGRGPYYVMREITGKSLRGAMEELQQSQNAAGVYAFVTRYVEPLVKAIALAHQQGVVHLDIKPENVLISESDEVFAIDWGIARFLESSQASEDGGRFGTPRYMSPEQICRQPKSDSVAADVWALGAILCEIMTGQPPYGENLSVRQIFPLVSEEEPILWPGSMRLQCHPDRELEPELFFLIEQILERDPARRPPSAVEVLEIFQSWKQARDMRARNQLAQKARAEELELRLRLESRRKRLFINALGVVGSLLLGVIFLSWRYYNVNLKLKVTILELEAATVARLIQEGLDYSKNNETTGKAIAAFASALAIDPALPGGASTKTRLGALLRSRDLLLLEGAREVDAPYGCVVDPGRRLIALQHALSVELIDFFLGTTIAQFAHSDLLEDLAFSPDTRWLATSSGNQVLFWDIESRKRSGVAISHASKVYDLAFDPSGQWLLVISDSETGSRDQLWVYSTQSRTVVAGPLAFDVPIKVFTACDRQLRDWGMLQTFFATATAEEVVVWKMTIPLEVHDEPPKLTEHWRSSFNDAENISFSPDGVSILAFGNREFDAHPAIWKVSDASEIQVSLPSTTLRSFASFDPSGKFLLTIDKDVLQARHLNDFKSRKPGRDVAPEKNFPHDSQVIWLDFCMDRRLMLTVTRKGTVRIWDFSTAELVAINLPRDIPV
jgi:serine/threonine protein kinase/WD40 repeat protein